MSFSDEEEEIRLMLRAREGDVEAFALLFDRHRQRVENFLYRLFWDRGKAEDGAQVVFLRLWMARSRYEARSRFTTFLYQVARNYWRDEIRKAKARPEEVAWDASDAACGMRNAEWDTIRPSPIPHPVSRIPHSRRSASAMPLRAPAATEPHYQLFVRYRQWRIREAIGRLPEIYRIVFVLGHLEGRKIAETAQILEIPEGTVKSRMHTAVRLLRAWLQAEEEEIER
jgi:RNA polymerase sigma-70 factor (ECF subfamily)